jgi:hypothetical protein
MKRETAHCVSECDTYQKVRTDYIKTGVCLHRNLIAHMERDKPCLVRLV